MTLAGTFEIVLTLALVLIAAYPLGAFMAGVFENRRTFLTPIIGPVERGLYRVAGVDPESSRSGSNMRSRWSLSAAPAC